MCRPITNTRTEKDAETGEDTVRTWRSFIYQSAWFVISQTQGKDVQPEPIPAWNKGRALAALNIEQVEFLATDGNVQGYAAHRTFALNPVAQLPAKTMLHEIGHI